MKTLLPLITILLFALFVNAQVVNIPDANFKAALVDDLSINTNGDGEIQVSEALATTNINVRDSHITDLSGIEAFTNLT